MVPKQKEWRSAVDPKTGRTYYYDVHTRETQWRKPLELATPEERRLIEEKERQQREFFRSMEANILKAMDRGHVPGGAVDNHCRLGSSREGHDVRSSTRMQTKLAGLSSTNHATNTTTITRIRTSASHSLRTSNNTKGASSTSNGTTALLMQLQENQRTNTKTKKVQAAIKKPSLIRTISSMDDELIAELTHVKENNVTLNTGMISPDSTTTSFFDLWSVETFHPPKHPLNQHNTAQYPRDCGNLSDTPLSIGLDPSSRTVHRVTAHPTKAQVSKHLQKPTMMKRNTCGSLYINNTMADPDKDACIKCLCGVFRTHIIQSVQELENIHPRPLHLIQENYTIFNDDYVDRQSTSSCHAVILEVGDSIEMMRIDRKKQIPSLDEITFFYRFVFNKAQMENDCIIMSLIYVERLLRETNGGVRPNVKNWRSILFSCMVLASKVWDDLSMWNGDFSHACPEGVVFSLQRINQLELALLTCLKYNVKVSASEYAKYYFLMRSMMIRSGLTDKEMLCNNPLDICAAKKLECVSSNYGKAKPSNLQRSKSMDGIEVLKDSKCPLRTHPATLEQVVRL